MIGFMPPTASLTARHVSPEADGESDVLKDYHQPWPYTGRHRKPGCDTCPQDRGHNSTARFGFVPSTRRPE